MPHGLSLNAEGFRGIAQQALEQTASYLETLASRRITPLRNSSELRAALHEDLPQNGCDPHALLAFVEREIVSGLRHNGHPRFFGYVASPASPITATGCLLAATVNANVTAWRSAPAAVELEHITIDWIKQMIGYPAEASGLFVSGGSMANFAGIAAARANRFPEANRRGLPEGRARIYASKEAHFSVLKAAAMLGMGTDAVRVVATDTRHRMDVSDLELSIQSDIRDGLLPVCIVATAGTVSTGAIDPLQEIAILARRHDIWLHVDGCYGGLAAIAPSAKDAFAHLCEADSVALDPHKWMYVPLDCGCILYRDGNDAKAAFSHDAEYTRPVGFADREAFAFWDYGPELSRPFRALNVWMQIKSAGVRGLAAAIERNIHCARYFEQLVDADEDFEMLAPAQLSIFCFRYAPKDYDGDLDRLNERVMIELQNRGSSYVSNARVNGRFALRGCIVNFRTEEHDMDRLLHDVRAAALAVRHG